MKLELKLVLSFIFLSLIISEFGFLNVASAAFLSGILLALGLMFCILNFMPEKILNYFFYRKLLKLKTDK